MIVLGNRSNKITVLETCTLLQSSTALLWSFSIHKVLSMQHMNCLVFVCKRALQRPSASKCLKWQFWYKDVLYTEIVSQLVLYLHWTTHCSLWNSLILWYEFISQSLCCCCCTKLCAHLSSAPGCGKTFSLKDNVW